MNKQIPKIYAIIRVFPAYALWGTGKIPGAEEGETLEEAFVT